MTNLNDLSKQQLTEAMERFNLPVDNRWNEATLAGKLIEAGVTFDQIKGAMDVLSETEGKGVDSLAIFEGDKPTEGARVVLKMDRMNRSYSINGYKFTSDHPYVVMDREDAEWICDVADGFRIADPSEAAKFYKGV